MNIKKPRYQSPRYRSKFERTIHKQIPRFVYEGVVLTYTVPSLRRYTPDFYYGNLIIETKGRFTSSDRMKMIYVKQSNPNWDIRLVFMRDNYLYKGSKTKYSDWAIKNGFKFAIGSIPTSWKKELTKHG